MKFSLYYLKPFINNQRIIQKKQKKNKMHEYLLEFQIIHYSQQERYFDIVKSNCECNIGDANFYSNVIKPLAKDLSRSLGIIINPFDIKINSFNLIN